MPSAPVATHSASEVHQLERDVNGTNEVGFRRHNHSHSRFDWPDPYDGNYNVTNPRSFNLCLLQRKLLVSWLTRYLLESGLSRSV